MNYKELYELEREHRIKLENEILILREKIKSLESVKNQTSFLFKETSSNKSSIDNLYNDLLGETAKPKVVAPPVVKIEPIKNMDVSEIKVEKLEENVMTSVDIADVLKEMDDEESEESVHIPELGLTSEQAQALKEQQERIRMKMAMARRKHAGKTGKLAEAPGNSNIFPPNHVNLRSSNSLSDKISSIVSEEQDNSVSSEVVNEVVFSNELSEDQSASTYIFNVSNSDLLRRQRIRSKIQARQPSKSPAPHVLPVNSVNSSFSTGNVNNGNTVISNSIWDEDSDSDNEIFKKKTDAPKKIVGTTPVQQQSSQSVWSDSEDDNIFAKQQVPQNVDTKYKTFESDSDDGETKQQTLKGPDKRSVPVTGNAGSRPNIHPKLQKLLVNYNQFPSTDELEIYIDQCVVEWVRDCQGHIVNMLQSVSSFLDVEIDEFIDPNSVRRNYLRVIRKCHPDKCTKISGDICSEAAHIQSSKIFTALSEGFALFKASN